MRRENEAAGRRTLRVGEEGQRGNFGVIEGGFCDPTTSTHAGGTPGSKITALAFGRVEDSAVRCDSRGF